MVTLDRTEQRIVGVLIEKQRTVPDTYPMTENALVNGCNQSSNRDPVMSLERFEVAGALMAMHGRDVVRRVEGGGRVAKYRHRLDELLGVGEDQLAVLAELMLRGPQAPGALKPRVARMGFHGTPDQVESVLREMAAMQPPLCAQEPKRPRERDHRWRQLLGGEGDAPATADVALSSAQAPPPTAADADAAATAPRGDASGDLLRRLEALEQRVEHLEQALGEPRSESPESPESPKSPKSPESPESPESPKPPLG